MKQYIITLLLCCSTAMSMAQGGMFGAKVGVGYTTAYDSKKTFSAEAFYLHKVNYHIFAGIVTGYQRFSLLDVLKTSGPISYGDVVSISHKTSYLYLNAKADIGVGYRKIWHFHAAGGPAFFVGGEQVSNTHQPFWTPPGGTPYGADTVAVNTQYNIRGVVPRAAFGITERIPTHRYWNITLTQEIGLTPGGLSKGVPGIKTQYVCFQVGLMHKYPHVRVEY